MNQSVSKCIHNFTDLVPKENVEKWLKYLRNEFPTVAFKASTQEQTTNLVSILIFNCRHELSALAVRPEYTKSLRLH